MTDGRGKRRMAWGLFWTDVVLLIAGLVGIVLVPLEKHQVDAVVSLVGAWLTMSGVLIPLLMGLDAAGATIIPAMKREQP